MIKKHAPQTATHDVGHALQALQLNEQDLQSVKTLPPGSGVFNIPAEDLGTVKYPLHMIRALRTNKETLKNYQYRLQFGKDKYDLVDPFNPSLSVSREALEHNIDDLIIQDFDGVSLDYWEKKVLTACYCLIDKQGANNANPRIYISSIADLYQEVLDKNKGGRFGGKEREKFGQAFERLQTRKHQFVYTKIIKQGDKRKDWKMGYVILEAPIISKVVYHHTVNLEDSQSVDEIKQKGGRVIWFNTPVLDQIVDLFRLLPRNFPREVRAICPDVKKVTPLMEGFIHWLSGHNAFYIDKKTKKRLPNTEIRVTRDEICRALHIATQYRQKKGRTTKDLLKCYDVAKRTGYLTDYQIDQRGKGEIVDVFLLNPDKMPHIKAYTANEEALLLEADTEVIDI